MNRRPKVISNANDWVPQPKQVEALSRSEREVAFGGSRFGGKTETGMAWLIEPEYVLSPYYKSVVIRRDYDDLEEWLERARIFYDGIGDVMRSKPAQIRWKGGGTTWVGHWKDKNTISKYVGKEIHHLLLEELNQSIATEDEYVMLLGSVRSTVPGLRAQVFSTFNPGGIGHKWLVRRFVNCCEDKTFVDPKTGMSRIFIRSSYLDNPLGCERDPEYANWLNGLGGALGKAWRDGDFNAFQGQFFGMFGDHNRIMPFELPSDCWGDLWGSLDHGIGHNTSFGLWWLDRERRRMVRLFTYSANGGTTAGHAEAIWQAIAGFRWTRGQFPVEIYHDPSMSRRHSVNDFMNRSDLDEYEDLFRSHEETRHVRFLPAYNRKVDGCHHMHMAFDPGMTGEPEMVYFDGYNETFVESILSAERDPNNEEVYPKFDGDDTIDEARYGIAAGRNKLNSWVREAQMGGGYGGGIEGFHYDFGHKRFARHFQRVGLR